MADKPSAFVGSVPENYDRYMGPLFFYPYADDLVARLPVTDGMRVLEVACGTGIVTRRLAKHLGGRGSLVASDLSQSMLDYAQKSLADLKGIEWKQADALALPFADRSFNAAVCEFGIMFFPDKLAGARQVLRVLKSGGTFLFNVWDSVEHSPAARIAHEIVRQFFPEDPPTFGTIPFGYHDVSAIRAMLGEAGFVDIRYEVVSKTTRVNFADAAKGLVEGTPMAGAIAERKPEAMPEIRAAIAKRIATELGEPTATCPLRAIVFSARRP